MADAMFHIIAIVVAAWGVITGYRHGLTGMVTSVLGLAFGLIIARIVGEGLTDVIEGILPSGIIERSDYYLSSNLACGGVFLIVYSIFVSITSIIRKAIVGLASGLFNSLMGAIFCLYDYLLILSVCYNIIVGFDPECRLMRHGKADDGNIIEAVMWIAPAALGSESFGEFALQEQLREARKISRVVFLGAGSKHQLLYPGRCYLNR